MSGDLMDELNSKFFSELHDIMTADSMNELERIYNSAQELMSRYRCAIMEIETKFKVLNEQFSQLHERNPIELIKTRLKSFESIRDKLERKGCPFNIESIENNLFDVAGIRVICAFLDDIYMLAKCLTEQDDITLIKQKDYIKNPKPNGYRSLHLIVEVPIFLRNEKRSMKVEVQLRTMAMEFWANLEHRMRYKKNLPDDLLAATAEELNSCANASAELDLKMLKIRDVLEQ